MTITKKIIKKTAQLILLLSMVQLCFADDLGNMQQNEWREFDINSVKGETPAKSNIFKGKQPSIDKYKFKLMYPFDGSVGFFGGGDFEDKYVEARKQKLEGTYTHNSHEYNYAYKNETAYLFRTIDDGKTFTRMSFGHGTVESMLKADGVYFMGIKEQDTENVKTFRSIDFGETWQFMGDFYLHKSWQFTKDRFVFTTVNKKGKKTIYKKFYTTDGGKTSKPLDQRIKELKEKAQSHSIYKEKFVFLIGRELVFVDLDTMKEERKPLKLPPYKTFTKNPHMTVDSESGKLYFVLEDINGIKKEKGYKQTLIWFPFTNELVEFKKNLPVRVPMGVHGDYIGGIFKYKGVLTHAWTLNKGIKWNFEVLPHYSYNTYYTRIQNKRIYMRAMVYDKDGVKDGSYIMLGKIK